MLYQVSNGLQFGIREHQPFAARAIEVDLYPGVLALAFIIQDDALAKLAVHDPLPQRKLCLRHISVGSGLVPQPWRDDGAGFLAACARRAGCRAGGGDRIGAD